MRSHSIIERAFQLAQSGRVNSIEDIKRVLEREQFLGVTENLAGNAIRKQLRAKITEYCATSGKTVGAGVSSIIVE